MGFINGALFAGFLLTIAYSIYENSKTIPVDGVVVDISSDISLRHAGEVGRLAEQSIGYYAGAFSKARVLS